MTFYIFFYIVLYDLTSNLGLKSQSRIHYNMFLYTLQSYKFHVLNSLLGFFAYINISRFKLFNIKSKLKLNELIDEKIMTVKNTV